MLTLFLAIVMAATPQPIMQGKATFYAEPYIGREMRGGGIYTGLDMTCAVSSNRWQELRGATLRVCLTPITDCDWNSHKVQPQPVSNPDEFNYEPIYRQSIDNSCQYDGAAMCAEHDQNGNILHCSQSGCNRTQTKCIIVEVTDTGAFGANHIDLSVSAFRALRPYGTPHDNDGVLLVQVWRIE